MARVEQPAQGGYDEVLKMLPEASEGDSTRTRGDLRYLIQVTDEPAVSSWYGN